LLEPLRGALATCLFGVNEIADDECNRLVTTVTAGLRVTEDWFSLWVRKAGAMADNKTKLTSLNWDE
jgi:hypothetical protein